MRADKINYKKNMLLIIIFFILLSVCLIVALGLAHNYTRKSVENEFYSQKIKVMEATILPYENFYKQALPEISYYQGFLDSSSAKKYSDQVLHQYPFIDEIVFFDAKISNHKILDGIRINNLAIAVKSIHRFGKNVPKDSVVLFNEKSVPGSLKITTSDEFNKVGLKVGSFISGADTSKVLTSDQIFKTFYNIGLNRITYTNILRKEEIKLYSQLMKQKTGSSGVYEQDFFSFNLNPYKLPIVNNYKELYEAIQMKPVSFEPVQDPVNTLVTSIALTGAFSNYQLYFTSSKNHISKETTRRFLPIGIGIFLLYAILNLIMFLIYRNFDISRKLFRLQYDFINNFTHEFKTPVSVIKIAGNNIKSAKVLSEKEKELYGRILDEEADKLNDLMNKLLSFTQIENKTIKVKYDEINLEVFSQNIIDAYQIKYPDYNIVLEIKNVKTFYSDPVLLSSIYHNLLENAYKYANKDSKNVKINISLVKKNIVFIFTDTGIGIEKKELVNIFKKFYRIQSQYNQQGSVGLGLAFCKELVNFMNGDITVKSKPGKGSQFKVTLPYEK